MFRSRSFRVTLVALAAYAVAFSQPWTLFAQAPVPSKVKFATIAESDMRDFLGTLASDAFQGRQIYTEGYGLATAYVADHLKQWSVKPMGDDGTYFQAVKNRGYRVTRNSSVTVETGGQTKTFKHGDHVTFPLNSGGKQTLTFNGVEFAGYGIVALPNATSTINYNDFAGRDVKGRRGDVHERHAAGAHPGRPRPRRWQSRGLRDPDGGRFRRLRVCRRAGAAITNRSGTGAGAAGADAGAGSRGRSAGRGTWRRRPGWRPRRGAGWRPRRTGGRGGRHHDRSEGRRRCSADDHWR